MSPQRLVDPHLRRYLGSRAGSRHQPRQSAKSRCYFEVRHLDRHRKAAEVPLWELTVVPMIWTYQEMFLGLFQRLGGNEIHTRGRLKKLFNEQSSVVKNGTKSMTLRRVFACGKTTQVGRDLTHFKFHGQQDSQLA